MWPHFLALPLILHTRASLVWCPYGFGTGGKVHLIHSLKVIRDSPNVLVRSAKRKFYIFRVHGCVTHVLLHVICIVFNISCFCMSFLQLLPMKQKGDPCSCCQVVINPPPLIQKQVTSPPPKRSKKRGSACADGQSPQSL